ncbi:hypothetical protein GCM10009754_74430 [Amycolatopsis minnesotensis]|uniref:Secreted protein n=1 Tax=Amycolatopsis minnesotensis TaxID=337894 RepID=A0ABN2SG19_9PSEU
MLPPRPLPTAAPNRRSLCLIFVTEAGAHQANAVLTSAHLCPDSTPGNRPGTARRAIGPVNETQVTTVPAPSARVPRTRTGGPKRTTPHNPAAALKNRLISGFG